MKAAKKALFILSDGGDNEPPLFGAGNQGPGAGSRCPHLFIGLLLGMLQGGRFWKKCPRKPEGAFIRVRKMEDLPAAIEKLSRDLRSQYLLRIACSPLTRMIYIPANKLCAAIVGRPVQAWARSLAQRRPSAGAGRRSHRRSPGMECRVLASWSPHVPELAQLGTDARDRRRRGVQRRHERSAVPRLQWVEWKASAASSAKRPSFLIDGKRSHVAVQSGWGIDSRARPPQWSPSRRIPRGT